MFAPAARAALVLTCAASASCAMIQDRGEAPVVAGVVTPVVLPGAIEPVHAAAIAQDQAVFWVSSNGCTAKADLTPVVRESGEGPIITLRRLKEDRCRNLQPEGVEMRWSFEEMGLTPGARVSVDNPYQLPSG